LFVVDTILPIIGKPDCITDPFLV